MLKADLHVHSRYSANPADVLLKKFGTQESYTELDEIADAARDRGMNCLTVTDHNVADGSFELVRRYPDRAFSGVELTTRFPEDDCAVHLLVYGFSREQFVQLSRLRPDIYQLRDYIRKERLAYSVAHATYSVNGRLKLAHLEKLILLFDVFEVINGTRAAVNNDLLKEVLGSLTPRKIEELCKRYPIEPVSEDPWIKGFTGGSDEHAGLFIGDTYTAAEGNTRDDFLAALRSRKTRAGGRSNHYKTQVFTFLKIAYEASRRSRRRGRGSVWNDFCAVIYDGRAPGWKIRLKVEQMKRSRRAKHRTVANTLSQLITRLTQEPALPVSQRVDAVYEAAVAIEDAFFIMNAESVREAFSRKDLFQMVSALTALFRSLFLSLPFLGTFRHLHQSSALMDEFRRRFLGGIPPAEKRILWITDTLGDLNGVSVTLENFASEAAARGRKVVLAAVGAGRIDGAVDLPQVAEDVPDFYSTFILKVPSLLGSLERVYAVSPTEIVVSTPGPAGLIGLLAARLFGIPCRGVYHSDFTRMAELGLSGGTVKNFIQGYVRWFYSCLDEIMVPTVQSRELLIERGYDPGKLADFRRGVDRDMFSPQSAGECAGMRRDLGIGREFMLLYVGRISRDKSSMMLEELYRELKRRGAVFSLVISGDGPDLPALRSAFGREKGVYLTGTLDRARLPLLYSAADLLVFPSTMDTFGMAVLEAQACGLPALVTDMGGPQEIIFPEETGLVLPAGNVSAWVDGVEQMMRRRESSSRAWEDMRLLAREKVLERFNWDEAVRDFFEDRKRYACSACGRK